MDLDMVCMCGKFQNKKISRLFNIKAAFAVILIVVLAYVSAVDVYAASGAPTIMSYQGRLSDSSGNLLGGSSGTTYYFKFSIWDSSTVDAGNKLWPTGNPTATTATVKSGVFNVNIGDTDNGYPDTLDYDFNINKNIYLQVEVSSNNSSFQTLSPRQRISASAFARLAGAISGTGQSMIGTTTPVSGAVATIEATTTSAIPLVIRGFLDQVADLFRIVTDTGTRLLTFTADGNLGIGTTTPNRKLSIFDANSVPQIRLSQSGSLFGEFYADSVGDVRLSSNSGNGGNFRMQNENLWVCSGGSCDPSITVAGEGNVVVETAVIFDNKFKLKQTNASTTIMYDTTDTAILQFDESQ